MILHRLLAVSGFRNRPTLPSFFIFCFYILITGCDSESDDSIVVNDDEASISFRISGKIKFQNDEISNAIVTTNPATSSVRTDVNGNYVIEGRCTSNRDTILYVSHYFYVPTQSDPTACFQLVDGDINFSTPRNQSRPVASVELESLNDEGAVVDGDQIVRLPQTINNNYEINVFIASIIPGEYKVVNSDSSFSVSPSTFEITDQSVEVPLRVVYTGNTTPTEAEMLGSFVIEHSDGSAENLTLNVQANVNPENISDPTFPGMDTPPPPSSTSCSETEGSIIRSKACAVAGGQITVSWDKEVLDRELGNPSRIIFEILSPVYGNSTTTLPVDNPNVAALLNVPWAEGEHIIRLLDSTNVEKDTLPLQVNAPDISIDEDIIYPGDIITVNMGGAGISTDRGHQLKFFLESGEDTPGTYFRNINDGGQIQKMDVPWARGRHLLGISKTNLSKTIAINIERDIVLDIEQTADTIVANWVGPKHGTPQLRLLDINGRLLEFKNLDLASGITTETLPRPQVPGTYTLALQNNLYEETSDPIVFEVEFEVQ